MEQRLERYLKRGIGSKKQGEEQGTMKYVGMVLLICFVVGIICANLIDRERLSGLGIWNTYFIEKFKYSQIRSEELFYYILEERIPVILLLLLLAFTNWGVGAGMVFMGWQGFAGGFLMSASIVSYGFSGFFLIGTALFPQYLIYIPVYLACLYLARLLKERLRTGKQQTQKGRIREYLLFASICLLILSVYIAGIFMESYFNPYLLKKIVKFF